MKISEYKIGRIGIDKEIIVSRMEFAYWLRKIKNRAKARKEKVKKYKVRSTTGFVFIDSEGNESQSFMSYKEYN